MMNKFFKASVLSVALIGSVVGVQSFAKSTYHHSQQVQAGTMNIHGISIEQGKIYSDAHRKSISDNMQKVRYNNNGIEMVGNVYFPKNFNQNKRYPAIVVGHPGGGVKEQASGLYAKLLAEKGFIAIAFDASYQGESGGLPRRLEKPENRIGDFHATVDYLTTLPYVDKDKIALLGICASGGFTTQASLTDKRVKALATVSAFHRYTHSWDGKEMSLPEKETAIKTANEQRNLEAKGGEVKLMEVLFPVNADTPKDLAEAYDYYTGKRGFYPTANNRFTVSSLQYMMGYNALNNVDKLLTQPLLVVSGDVSGSRWQSEEIYNAAKNAQNKELFLVKGAGHMDLYNQDEYVGQVVDKLTEFYQANLK
ncbi:alpha/beta hydrolase [Alysiella crassa]|uniref:Uncharacterized conserved protein n=1 Tax=Alysiella crassa TaxID=153491 RepID=A0A376BP85_9NEIS|nr:alpha/beta hydrolase [Alysiella crassa]UOP06840.1 alpha/beta hydrolase [Alysiella crassa]SSY71034.1 Uncharacterized conserved protein [Alysiella crassa]